MATTEIIKVETSVDQRAPKKEFKGYTMEELRYQKALASLRKEFCRYKVASSIQSLKRPFGDSKMTKALPAIGTIVSSVPAATTAGGIGKTLLKTVTGRMRPWDFVFLGVSLLPPAFKMIKKFRKKKKNKSS